ncbi:uncharacterized protein LOC128677332 [Plodia interpunctella]|uniref:uncharacterized protein LOC128677332 n=1 Tax=Plodia interpunctella TaxID=58824 RepID=UPI0023675B4C|nr:uncharacterized protein LOC128677332 [Plodia interpunctella]
MISKTFILFAVLAAAPVFGDWVGGLRVRFGVGFSGYFMSKPRSIAEAKTSRWQQVARPEGPLASLIMYCPADYIFCVLFDDTEYIAGLQIAIPKDKFTDNALDWEVQGFTSWTPANTNSSFWTIQQYFVDEEILGKSVSERLAARDRSKTIPHGKVWVTGVNKELLEISTKKTDIENSIFTEQACIPLMGRHYYYNMTTETQCTSAGMYPWFPLVASGELIGMGFVSVGKLPESSLETDYFERPERAAIEMIVPRGPSCLYQLGDSPGLLTMHIYYIHNPLLLTCIFQ